MNKKNIKYYKFIIFSVLSFYIFFSLLLPTTKAADSCSTSKNYVTNDSGLENDPCVTRTTKDECLSGPYYHKNKGYDCVWNGPNNTTGKVVWVWVDGGSCGIKDINKHPNAGEGSISQSRSDLLKTCTSRTEKECSLVPYYSSDGTGWYCEWTEGVGSWVQKIGQSTETLGNANYVATKDATDISDTSVKLVGEVNPNGDTKIYFRLSPSETPPIFCNDIYGSAMRATNETKVSGNTPQEISLVVANLSQNTTYYYCAVSSNTNGIWYGGVKKFTTEITPPIVIDDKKDITKYTSINTKEALVVDENSAYLNGTYNTVKSGETWFVYRKTGIIQSTTKEKPVSFLKSLENKILSFFKTKEAVATTTNNIPWSDRMGVKKHSAGTSGSISYLLKGLSAATTYEFKTVIKLDSSDETLDGTALTFTTKSVGEINPLGDVGGVTQTDPCANVDSDIHCNGTGDPVIIDSGLPDLTAGTSYPSNFVVNILSPISSSIINHGKSATGKDFYGFFQISTIDPNLTSDNNTLKSNTNNQKTSMLHFDNFFKTNIALATTNTLVNLPQIPVLALSALSSTTLIENYTFPTTGIYYVRACVDKKDPSDVGIIKESNENNNCGAWTKIKVSLDNSSWINPEGGSTNDWGNGNGENNGSGGSGNNTWNGNGGNGNTNNNNTNTNGSNPTNLKLGDTATPPIDATVHYHEGIETVFARQIVADTNLAKIYGYQDGADLQSFAWNLADILARTFGYVNSNGNEIRVSFPDIAAYQLYINNGILTVYEYYDSKIVNIQKMTDVLRNKYDYEYYFKK